MSSRPAWLYSECKARVNHTIRPCLEKSKLKIKKIQAGPLSAFACSLFPWDAYLALPPSGHKATGSVWQAPPVGPVAMASQGCTRLFPAAFSAPTA